jgi:hypothetical protein
MHSNSMAPDRHVLITTGFSQEIVIKDAPPSNICRLRQSSESEFDIMFGLSDVHLSCCDIRLFLFSIHHNLTMLHIVRQSWSKTLAKKKCFLFILYS